MNRTVMKFKQKNHKLITYKELQNIPFNEEIDFSHEQDKSILCTRLADTKSGMSFRVDMLKNKKWEVHEHDCDETILMYKGILKCLLSKTIMSRGSIIEISAGTHHEIQAETDSEFYVEFKKP